MPPPSAHPKCVRSGICRKGNSKSRFAPRRGALRWRAAHRGWISIASGVALPEGSWPGSRRVVPFREFRNPRPCGSFQARPMRPPKQKGPTPVPGLDLALYGPLRAHEDDLPLIVQATYGAQCSRVKRRMRRFSPLALPHARHRPCWFTTPHSFW